MPGLGGTPYDSAEYVLQIARSLGNDAIQSLAGNLLSDNQPYVPIYLNSGYRYLQRKLANSGYSAFKKTAQIVGVPVIGTVDPGLQMSISYNGTFDGVMNHATPSLPPDMCWPLKLRERQTNTTQIWQPMYQATDGLMSRPQTIWLRDWYWETEQIVMRGSVQVNDIEILYTPFLPELILLPSPSEVLLIRSENALAAYTLWAFAFARGSKLADELMAMGDRFVKEMIASDNTMKARRNVRRQPYSRRAHSGWGWC